MSSAVAPLPPRIETRPVVSPGNGVPPGLSHAATRFKVEGEKKTS